MTRLKEQLRSLEIETEAQILHGHEDEAGHRSDFDPLELDRYSSIQQFSRALAETANDVASIQAAARERWSGGAEPAAAAGAHRHRTAERPDAHAHGALPAPRAAPGAHRAPGRGRHRQARRARRRGRLRWSSTGRCSSACCRRSSTCCAMPWSTASRRPRSASRAANREAGRILLEPAARGRRGDGGSPTTAPA